MTAEPVGQTPAAMTFVVSRREGDAGRPMLVVTSPELPGWREVARAWPEVGGLLAQGFRALLLTGRPGATQPSGHADNDDAPRPPLAPVRSSLSDALRHKSAGVRSRAKRAQAAIAALEETLDRVDQRARERVAASAARQAVRDKAKKEREAARQRVLDLERQLREARAALRGKPTGPAADAEWTRLADGRWRSPAGRIWRAESKAVLNMLARETPPRSQDVAS